MQKNFFSKALKAFTVVELVMSIFIMAFATIIALKVSIKKNPTPKKVVDDAENIVICEAVGGDSCTYGVKMGQVDASNKDSFLTSKGKEFFEIHLIGAGAKGGSVDGADYCAGAGQEKTVIYPALNMPFARSNEKECESPMCEECDENNKSFCTKCTKGYVPKAGVCEMNFTYRIKVGKTPGSTGNGGKTTLEACPYDDNGREIVEPQCVVLEVASGGTVYLKPEGVDCPDQATSSKNGKGMPGADGEGWISW